MAKMTTTPPRRPGETSDQVFVAPAPGRTVPRLDGQPWPEAGDWLDEDQYVRRRLSDGDLVAGTPPVESPAPETADKKVK